MMRRDVAIVHCKFCSETTPGFFFCPSVTSNTKQKCIIPAAPHFTHQSLCLAPRTPTPPLPPCIHIGYCLPDCLLRHLFPTCFWGGRGEDQLLGPSNMHRFL